MTETAALRWIPLLPLASAVIGGTMLGLLRRPLSRGVTIAISCGSVLGAFLVSLAAVWRLVGLPENERLLIDTVGPWITSGQLRADLSFALDPISAVMILLVSGVGLLIHVYSIGYMDDDHREDKGFQRFFCYLNLFTFSMLTLVLGDNLVLMFLGWEGVGLCSYLLIGFWYADRWNAVCGMKAFIVNRIGDFAFLVGIFLLFTSIVGALPEGRSVGAVVFRDIEAVFPLIAEKMVRLPDWLSFLPGAPEWKLATLIGLCFFVGAVGKSAQIPLYVWLPDAMAGPTPVSALIHAATMVTAGVYMVCRLSFLYAEAPGASAVIAWTGGATALFAATIALVQTDIKKVLAYSTVSQLGYMFLAAGCGGYAAAMFHLLTHGFFKALLFLGAGAVILALHHEQDMEKMGGLNRFIPWWRPTHLCFLMGVLAIAGTPGFSGFFSKDEILLAAYTAEKIPGHVWLWGIGVVTAGLTAFYMFRLHFRVFFGQTRIAASLQGHVHEAAPTVTVPLVVLALLAIFGGYAGLPQVYGDMLGIAHSNSLGNFLAPSLAGGHGHAVSAQTELGLGGVAVAVAVAGVLVAFVLYLRRPGLADRLASALPGVYRLLVGRYWIDELYDRTIVRPLVWISERVLFRGIDAGLIDGLAVMGTARSVRSLASRGLRFAQTGFTQTYFAFMIAGAAAVVVYLLG
ncbi:MAG: NADH-quinone oxidoreductase subunit L [Deltaproteobacteria bacterium]|nr:NADH-quinone oxidoreductase subunit L [Deltaproteobacteria bacterium]